MDRQKRLVGVIYLYKKDRKTKNKMAIKTLLTLIILLLPIASHAQNLLINSSHRGLNTHDEPGLHMKEECSEALNIEFDETRGLFTTRKGYSLLSSTDCTKLWEYPKSNGQLYLMRQAEKRLYYSLDKGQNWTIIRDDLNYETYGVQAAVYADKIWFVDGVDYLSYFDGDTYSEIELSYLKCKYIYVDKNTLFLASNISDTDRVYYNIIGEDPTGVDAWPADNYIPIGTQNGDIITAIHSWSYNTTLIFMKYSIWAIENYVQDLYAPTLINSNYGCFYNESLAMDKGILKFMSHVGMKGFNGSAVIDIDTPVDNIFNDCNNLKGEYNYLRIGSASEFDAGISTGIEEGRNELSLKEYSYTWDSTNFSEGTNSNTQIKSNYVELSTTTATTTSPVDISVLSLAGRLSYIDTDTRDNEFLGLGDAVTGISYNDNHNMYDTGTNKLTTQATTGILNCEFSVSDHHTYLYCPNLPFYVFTISLPGTDTKVQSLQFTGDYSLGEIYIEYDTDGYNRYFAQARISLVCKVFISYLDGTTPTIRYKSLCDRTDIRHQDGSWIFNSKDDASENVYSKLVKSWSDNSFTFSLGDPRAVKEIKVTFLCTISTGLEFYEGLDFYARVPVIVSPIYDIALYETTTAGEYETSGYYLSSSTNIAGVSSNVAFAYAEKDVWSDYDKYTTTITCQIQSSTDNINWSDFQVLTGTRTKLTIPDGRYVRTGSSFTTSVSSYTPTLSGIKVTAIEPDAEWTSKKYNISEAEDWGKFMTDIDLNSQNTTYYMKLGTGSTHLDGVSFSTITSGDSIETLLSPTTNHTWTQVKLIMDTDDATKNIRLYSFVLSYAPDAAPIIPPAISINDKYYIGISTISGSTANTCVMVQDKNNAWTMFDMDVVDFCKFGKDTLFTDGSSIYKMNDGTDDADTAISWKYKRRFNGYQFSNDKWVDYFFITGKASCSGSYTFSYTVEGGTTTYSNSFDVTEGLFRNRFSTQQGLSAAQFFDITLSGTIADFEIHTLDIHSTTDSELTE